MTDPAVYDNNVPPAQPQDVHHDEVPSAISAYLHNIHEMPPVSEELQKTLASDIAAATAALRKSLNVFGFAIKEYIRLTGEVIAGTTRPEDVFSPSSLRKAGSTPVAERKFLQSILPQMNDLYLEYFNTFFSTGENRAEQLDAVRRKCGEALDVIPLNADRYGEFMTVIAELFMTPPTGNLSADALKIFPDGELKFIDEKFLFDRAELIPVINSAIQKFAALQSARHRMLEQNLRLAVTIAKGYSGKSSAVTINDVVQEGNLGLLRAIEKFDFELGYKFSTYAIWWIKQNISRFLADRSRIIRIPAHMIQTISAMNNAEQQFIMDNGREPLIEELAMTLEMPVARISAIRKMARQPVSLQAQATSDDDSCTLEDILPDENAEEPVDIANNNTLNEQLHHVVSLLPERDQTIIIDRFGLFGHRAHTLAELSEKFGLTRERVRQLEARILKRLRSPEMLKYFDLK
ncbi:MAG: sigma-70 family RNA polymerase sigma factor [Victivallaceae bacterium]|nr:sigma-70 family RNA polymerase sigma factor [Victivallaceae bacterium]